MNPDAGTLWRAPRWALAVLLACLGMQGLGHGPQLLQQRREGAQLVPQGEGGLRSLAGRGVEEGPGVAPCQRAREWPSNITGRHATAVTSMISESICT